MQMPKQEPHLRFMDALDKKFYAIAAAEVGARRFDPAIMAKAFADTKGDEKRSIAEYITLRVADLADQHEANVRSEREATVRREQAAKEMEAKRLREEKAVADKRATDKNLKEFELRTVCKKCGHRGKMERSFFSGEDHAYFSGVAVKCVKCGFRFDWHYVENV